MDSCAPPTGDLALNPGMCPNWELNGDLRVTGWYPTHWATPAGLENLYLQTVTIGTVLEDSIDDFSVQVICAKAQLKSTAQV